MSVAWIAPAVLAGLALIALPIAVHLLVRQQARSLAYPSLRFLRETQLAAFRRRRIEDAMLLLCRAAIIALAVMALAGPVLQMPLRTAGYANRTSRAVITLDGADPAVVSRIAHGGFGTASFRREAISDALADAVRWLNRQPPSAREIVIAGPLRRGSITQTDLAIVPEEIGVRFDPAPAITSNDITWSILTRRNDALARVDRAVHFDPDQTRVIDGPATEAPPDLVTIVARDQDDPLAQAALRAALDAGVPWSDFTQRVVIAWDGAADAATAGASAALMIRMPVPSPPSAAADAVHAALMASSPRRDHLEPVMIEPAILSSWSRTPGAPRGDPGDPLSGRIADEGDRRWLWGLVVVLLGVEAWMRSRRAALTATTQNVERRVG